MPHFGDPINQLGKDLAAIKYNAQAALRRAHPVIPKIERTRDIFDDTQPFEMFFDIDDTDKGVSMDLYFNKPPPACAIGDTRFCCTDFAEEPGGHLLQVPNPYVSGSVHVLINGNPQTRNIDWEERDPDNGLLYVNGINSSQFIDVCYIRQV